MTRQPDYASMLAVALEEARLGLAEGGIPIGAALFRRDGTLLGRGHNRRVQENDPSVHAETDAFRKAGRQRDYRDTIMVTTLAPCWYCSGLVRQFNLPIRIVAAETARAPDGLALSSRNGYLSATERAEAPRLIRLLRGAAEAIAAGSRDFAGIERRACGDLAAHGWQVDYVAVRAQATLLAPTEDCRDLVILAAARLGTTRLIDNLEVRAG